MAGTWMSIVEGFGGMRMKDDKLSFAPKIPKQWKSYSFKVNFRNRIIKVNVTENQTSFDYEGTAEMTIRVNGTRILLNPSQETIVANTQ
jgi:maltose phosphorylase